MDTGFSSTERERIREFDNKRIERSRLLSRIFLISCIVLLTFGLFLLVSESIALNSSVHQKAFNSINLTAQDISNNPKEQSDPIIIDHHIMEYFHNNDDLINVNYFTYDEKAHLRDVKHLVRGIYSTAYLLLLLAVISLILSYIYMRKAGSTDVQFTTRIIRVLQFSSGAAAALWVLFVVLFGLGQKRFMTAFLDFHKVFFPQGNYAFPSTALLIKVYPQAFFYDVTMLTVKYSMLIFLVIFSFATLAAFIISQKRAKSPTKN